MDSYTIFSREIISVQIIDEISIVIVTVILVELIHNDYYFLWLKIYIINCQRHSVLLNFIV